MYLLFKNQSVSAYPYADAQLKRDNPQVSFPKTLTAEIRAEFGVYAVQPTPTPDVDRMTYRVAELTPVEIDGAWHQAWEAQALSAEEVAAAYAASVPQSVTMRQARLALHAAGLLTSVNAAIAAIPEPDRTAASITWEFASSVDRGFGMVPQLAAALGMTETQIDDLFIAAAQL